MNERSRLFLSIARWVRGALTENLSLKAISLCAALGLAAYTRGQFDRTQRTIPVGVVTRLPPDSRRRELMTKMPEHIDVTIVGTTRAIDRLIQNSPSPAELDLRDGSTESIIFDKSVLSLPPDVELRFVDPPSINLEWQDVVTRTVPIQASRAGQPAKGYEVTGTLEVEPKEVDMKGPASLVEVLQFARLAAFDVTGLTDGSYRRRLAIDDPPPRVRILGSKSAWVTVVIARRQTEVKFDHRTVEVVGMPHARAIPPQVDVTVGGPPEVVSGLRADQVVPRVDLASAGIDVKTDTHGSTTLKVRAELSNAEAECQPPTVTVRW
jgi:YbbR domain-containing protein